MRAWCAGAPAVARKAAVLAAALSLVLGAEPARALDPDDVPPARFFLDRIEIGGGWGRQHCDEDGATDRATLASQGVRVFKFLSPTLYLGLDLGRVERTGSPRPQLEDGTTGALYVGLDDQDLAWSGGVTLHPDEGFPFVTGSARIGGRDDLHLSAGYAHSLPVFSSDDVDVGMGTGFGDGNLIWLGASMPINRDVVGFKAMAKVRPVARLEVTGAGRYGNSEAGRIEGFSVSLGYVNPEPSDGGGSAGAFGRFLEHEPARLEFVGAGGIVGAVAGVMVAGAAVQRPCGEAAFRPAVIGALVGSFLGAVFGNAMW